MSRADDCRLGDLMGELDDIFAGSDETYLEKAHVELLKYTADVRKDERAKVVAEFEKLAGIWVDFKNMAASLDEWGQGYEDGRGGTAAQDVLATCAKLRGEEV